VSDERGPVPVPEGPLTSMPTPPSAAPSEEPPAESAERERVWAAGRGGGARDMRPAVGTRGAPGSWRRAGAGVALARPGWADAVWSFLYKHDTRYGAEEVDSELVAEANRKMRDAPCPRPHGPFIKPPVWTWEVPLYFWFGGAASGAAFAALACDLVGDRRSARIARAVSLGLVAPAPLLLVADLGRPGRFLNMLRVFKPRSPMNLGAWCLMAFSASDAGAVGADLLDCGRAARALGAGSALLGSYLGSYTGVLLASTAVPVWSRSRLFLGPIFVATATGTGAAATRLTLVASGLPDGHPTREALSTIETAAMLVELALSRMNEHRLGRTGDALRGGRPRRLFAAAQWSVRAGLASRLAGRRLGPPAQYLASVLYLAAGLAFRFAWVEAGKASARDHEAVARAGRRGATGEAGVYPPQPARRLRSTARPAGGPAQARLLSAWTETVRRVSLIVEGGLHRLTRVDG